MPRGRRSGEKSMLYVEPDFFGSFVCTAGNCRHSCCVGWEIDIDRSTAEYYKGIEGETGEKLRSHIAFEPEPHFVLDGEDRCPFLRRDGLCELILGLGEDSLCNICREHPRFYNEFPQREERGLGLCCEEAVQLLLSSDEPLKLLYEGEEQHTPEVLKPRQGVMELFSDRSISLPERMKRSCILLGTDEFTFDAGRWKNFYLGLERLDDGWTEMLRSITDAVEPKDAALERIGEYMIFRHFPSADNKAEAADILKFVILSVYMIASIEAPMEDKLRMYSSEIEYSDENIGKIIAEINR